MVFEAVITRNVRLSEAPSHGKPVLLYDPESKGSSNYMELAKEVSCKKYKVNYMMFISYTSEFWLI